MYCSLSLTLLFWRCFDDKSRCGLINTRRSFKWTLHAISCSPLVNTSSRHQNKPFLKPKTRNTAHGLLIACFALEILHISCLFIRMMARPVLLHQPHKVELKIHQCATARPQYAHCMCWNDLACIDIAYKLHFWSVSNASFWRNPFWDVNWKYDSNYDTEMFYVYEMMWLHWPQIGLILVDEFLCCPIWTVGQ